MGALWGSRSGARALLLSAVMLFATASGAHAAGMTVTGTPISATAGSPFSGQVATISDSSSATVNDYSVTITWGDGSKSAGTVTATTTPGQFTVSGSHTWSAAGTYTVVTDVQNTTTGAAGRGISTATVAGGGGGGGPPVASLAVSTAHPTGGQLITFSGASSSPGTGHIISYDWDFNGDGHIDTSTGTNPIAHFILAPGLHTIGLTITNSGGQTSTTHSTFGVASPPVSFPQPDGGQGACQSTYDDGDVHILAGCIQAMAGGGYVIQTTQLDLNGMTIVPKAGGYGIYKIESFNHYGIGSGTQLSGPSSNVELLNTPIGDMVLGGQDLSATRMTLTYQAFVPPHVALHFSHDKKTPKKTPFSKTLVASYGIGQPCTGGSKSATCCPPSSNSSCATLPGNFPLTGVVNTYLDSNGDSLQDVSVGLDLSAVNFQATGSLEIVSNIQTGIQLSSLQFSIPEAGLASVFEVKNASFVYYFPDDPDPSKRDSWQAKATFIFGPLSQPSLAAELQFQHGDFHYASMLFTAPPGTGVPVYPGILINQIGGSVGVNPTQFGGQLGASIAEELELSLAFKYRDATDTQLGFFGGQGTLSLAGDQIATLAADVYSDGYTDAQLSIDLHFPFDSTDPVVKVFGSIGFWDEPSSGRWEADGDVGFKLWVISAEVAGLVNNEYAAGCADISGFGVQGRYSFSDGSIGGGFFGFSNCTDQLQQYKEMPVNQHSGGFVGSARYGAHAAAGGGGTIKLHGGTPGEELQVNSTSGTPVVTITAPDGKTYTTPAKPGQISTSGGEFISAIAPDTHQVLIFLRHPQGGKWNIEPVAGSAPISSVAGALDVPPAKFKIRVHHLHGRRFSAKYKITHFVHGTHVQFVERGRDSTRVLATVTKAKGKFKFTSQDAIARSRTIYAYLRTGSGAPLRTMKVGHYRAPAATRPGRVRHAHFARHGTSAVLSWKRSTNAREYRIVIRGSDGRVITQFPSGRKHSVAIAGVLPSTSLGATITPLGGPNLLAGKAARARLAAIGHGRVELLSCHGKRRHLSCKGSNVSGAVTAEGPVLAMLTRGGRVYGQGIASDTQRPKHVALNASRTIGAGVYKLTLREHRRTFHTSIRIR